MPVREPPGRIFVYGEKPEEIAGIIARVFGVVDVSVCTRVAADPAAVREAAVTLAGAHLHAPTRFAVRGKRQSRTGMNSQQLGEYVGSAICDAIPGLTVDLTHRNTGSLWKSGTAGALFTTPVFRHRAGSRGARRGRCSACSHRGLIPRSHPGL